ncbi:MAG: hypothetical protein DSY42_01835, partial [Aquifex sp.]
ELLFFKFFKNLTHAVLKYLKFTMKVASNFRELLHRCELIWTRDDNTYFVEFFQEYNSDSYADKGIKRMYIVREKGQLKILSEEFIMK